MRVGFFVKATADSDAGILLAGDGLKPTSQAKRVHFDGAKRTVTGGPFTETRELVAGYWLWEVTDMDEAVEWVKRCPNPMVSASDIDIRPVFGAADFEIAVPGATVSTPHACLRRCGRRRWV